MYDNNEPQLLQYDQNVNYLELISLYNCSNIHYLRLCTIIWENPQECCEHIQIYFSKHKASGIQSTTCAHPHSPRQCTSVYTQMLLWIHALYTQVSRALLSCRWTLQTLHLLSHTFIMYVMYQQRLLLTKPDCGAASFGNHYTEQEASGFIEVISMHLSLWIIHKLPLWQPSESLMHISLLAACYSQIGWNVYSLISWLIHLYYYSVSASHAVIIRYSWAILIYAPRVGVLSNHLK